MTALDTIDDERFVEELIHLFRKHGRKFKSRVDSSVTLILQLSKFPQ